MVIAFSKYTHMDGNWVHVNRVGIHLNHKHVQKIRYERSDTLKYLLISFSLSLIFLSFFSFFILYVLLTTFLLSLLPAESRGADFASDVNPSMPNIVDSLCQHPEPLRHLQWLVNYVSLSLRQFFLVFILVLVFLPCSFSFERISKHKPRNRFNISIITRISPLLPIHAVFFFHDFTLSSYPNNFTLMSYGVSDTQHMILFAIRAPLLDDNVSICCFVNV